MKAFNFNTLQNLPVPDGWVEKALAIPETADQKPVAVPLWRKPRFIAAAASLVLVSALSIALFLTMGSKNPLPVKPSSPPIIRSTDANGETVAEKAVTDPDSGRQDSTTPDQPKSALQRIIDSVFGTPDRSAQATSSPTVSDRIAPTAKAAPSESGHTRPTEGALPTEPAAPPTEPYATPPTEPMLSTTAPTEKETDAPREDDPPTEAAWYPDTPTEPTEPTVPKPTQSRYQPTVSRTVSSFNTLIHENAVIYCKITDDDGAVFGDADLFSGQHLASCVRTAGGYLVSYTPRDYGILPEDGRYSFVFYTQEGKTLLSGKAYLSAS